MNLIAPIDSEYIYRKVVSNNKKQISSKLPVQEVQPVKTYQMDFQPKISKPSSNRRIFALKERRERNRVAAKRSKQKQLQLEESLVEEIHQLERKNSHMQNEIIQLKSKKQCLELNLFEISLLEDYSESTALALSPLGIIYTNENVQQNSQIPYNTLRGADCDFDLELTDL
jgi:tRNA A37 N6-isopentenylltransferase MiaA